jgi:hypothetical protein
VDGLSRYGSVLGLWVEALVDTVENAVGSSPIRALPLETVETATGYRELRGSRESMVDSA